MPSPPPPPPPLLQAFAAIREEGSVVTWGHADFGGDSTGVQDRLKNVQQILGRPSGALFPFFFFGSGCPCKVSNPKRVPLFYIGYWASKDPGHYRCVCCHSGGWVCGDLGPYLLWWRQLRRATSAEERATDPSF